MSNNPDVFELYKPLRNKIRNYNLTEALFVVWAYSRNYTFGHSMPSQIELPSNFNQRASRHQRRMSGVLEFELEFLTREFIMHCNKIPSKKSILKKAELGKTVDFLRNNLEDGLFRLSEDKSNFLLDFQRYAHRQFKWQLGHETYDFMRYYKVFSDSELGKMIFNITGLTVQEIYMIGVYLFSASGLTFRHSYPIKSEISILSDEKFSRFFSLFAMTIEEAKEEMEATYKMDESILYSYNPLSARPILLDGNAFICPVHLLLFWRITGGLYYLIVNEPKFNQYFGDSFERYIGEVIEFQNNDKIKYLKEFKYLVGKDEKKSSDWILQDKDALLFIECKCKRMNQQAKSELSTTESLDKELNKMASFILQLYKTYFDYKANKYPCIPYDEELKFYPLVVTLEDWYINYNLRIPELLKKLVSDLLIEKNLDVSILESNPFYVRSTAEFEENIQVIMQIGIKGFFELIEKNQLNEFEKKFKYKQLFKEQYKAAFQDPLQQMKESII